MAAWTGVPQSFLEMEDNPSEYHGLMDLVLRDTIPKRRFNFRLQDEFSTILSWRPFGYVLKKDIELELWPLLELDHFRQYDGWIWWVRGHKGALPDHRPGFRESSGRGVAHVTEHLALVEGSGSHPVDHVKVGPSKRTTSRIMDVCVEDACGDCDWAIAAMPGVETHPWMKGFRGL